MSDERNLFILTFSRKFMFCQIFDKKLFLIGDMTMFGYYGIHIYKSFKLKLPTVCFFMGGYNSKTFNSTYRPTDEELVFDPEETRIEQTIEFEGQQLLFCSAELIYRYKDNGKVAERNGGWALVLKEGQTPIKGWHMKVVPYQTKDGKLNVLSDKFPYLVQLGRDLGKSLSEEINQSK